MQVPVDALGERAADAFDLGDVVHRRGLHAAQAAEMLDQRLAALRADPTAMSTMTRAIGPRNVK